MNSELDVQIVDEQDSMELLETESADLAAMGSLLSDVEVRTDRTEGRQRQLSAKIHIPYSVDQVWQILTDYDRLADFIPNLAKSRQITHPQNGIRIEQVGTQSLLRLKFCARVVLDMVERFPHQLDFVMIEGDFKEFSGSWMLQAHDEWNGAMLYAFCVAAFDHADRHDREAPQSWLGAKFIGNSRSGRELVWLILANRLLGARLTRSQIKSIARR